MGVVRIDGAIFVHGGKISWKIRRREFDPLRMAVRPSLVKVCTTDFCLIISVQPYARTLDVERIGSIMNGLLYLNISQKKP